MATPNRIKPEDEKERIDREGEDDNPWNEEYLMFELERKTYLALHIVDQIGMLGGLDAKEAHGAAYMLRSMLEDAYLRLLVVLDDIKSVTDPDRGGNSREKGAVAPEALERFLEAGRDALRPLEEVREDLRLRDDGTVQGAPGA